MYTESAQYYDAIYENRGKDYRVESEVLEKQFRRAVPYAVTLLDVACGTGLHIEQFVRRGLTARGIDLDPQMVNIASARCPGVDFTVGDMLGFALPDRFDVVTCLFGATAYLRTPERLRKAIGNLARHVAPGGVLLVEPFVLKADWKAGLLAADYVDRADLKLARLTVSPPAAPEVAIDFHYLIATPHSGVERRVEHHVLGLFTLETYREAFAAAGLTFEALAEPAFARGLYRGQPEGS